MNPNPTARPQPIFSPEDADLAALKWRISDRGYFRHDFYNGVVKKTIKAHRIVGARIAGRPLLASEEVDHIYADKSDNRRESLRITTHRGNSQNRKDKTGFRGAIKYPNGKWRAAVKHFGINIHLGYFTDRSEAAAAARRKREELGFLTGADTPPPAPAPIALAPSPHSNYVPAP
jgi:hypothetical protein